MGRSAKIRYRRRRRLELSGGLPEFLKWRKKKNEERNRRRADASALLSVRPKPRNKSYRVIRTPKIFVQTV